MEINGVDNGSQGEGRVLKEVLYRAQALPFYSRNDRISYRFKYRQLIIQTFKREFELLGVRGIIMGNKKVLSKWMGRECKYHAHFTSLEVARDIYILIF